MILPIGDENPGKRTPYVTYALIGLNCMGMLLVYQAPPPSKDERRRRLTELLDQRAADRPVVYRSGPGRPARIVLPFGPPDPLTPEDLHVDQDILPGRNAPQFPRPSQGWPGQKR